MSSADEKITKQLRDKVKEVDNMRRAATKRYYTELAAAKENNVPVVHMGGFGPPELVYAFGGLPCFPESYSTILCAKRQAVPFLQAAEARGVSKEVCSYARAILGMMWLNDGPWGPMPTPDYIISIPIVCDPHAKWWEIMADYYKCPIFHFDGPYSFTHDIDEEAVRWMADNMRTWIPDMEKITGQKFDHDRFKQIVALSGKAHELFQEIQSYKQAIPCPRGVHLDQSDAWYLINLLGTQECVDYFTAVRDVCKEMVENGVGIIDNEKYRLMWDNIPLWYNLQLFDYFNEKGAVFPASTYPQQMWESYHFDGNKMDPEQPFESIARDFMMKSVHNSARVKNNRIKKMIKGWHIDGMVIHVNRGCQVITKSTYEKEKAAQEAGIISMSFESEMADPRSYSDGQVKTRIDAFLEILQTRKAVA
ncbi:2-hydroxyacyl-CoA dehydratase subunit D [Thermodesulfobacteriota bacterium]